MARDIERAKAIVTEFVARPYKGGFSHDIVDNPTEGPHGCLIDALEIIPIAEAQRREIGRTASKSYRKLYPFGKRTWERIEWPREIDTIIEIVDEQIFELTFGFRGPTSPLVSTPLSRPVGGTQFAGDPEIPPFEMYDPTVYDMSTEEMAYFANMGRRIDAGSFPDVAGNISYLFAYTYILIAQWEKIGFEELHRMLATLCREYRSEAKFVEYCGEWASHCLLGMGRYDDFLAATEPTDLFSKDCSLPKMRCDVRYHLGRAADPIDLLRMSKVQVNEYTRKFPREFREHLNAVFAAEEAKSGPWFARLLTMSRPKRAAGKNFESAEMSAKLAPVAANSSGVRLFGRAHIAMLDVKLPVAPIKSHSFRTGTNAERIVETVRNARGHFLRPIARVTVPSVEIIAEAVRVAENRLRDANGVPRVGEGWISETELFNLIRDSFPDVTVEHHGRPGWLGRQHLDVWIPEWRIAVEYHGDQHFRPVEFFGGEAAFIANQERDRRKERLCLENRVKLFVVSETGRSEELLAAIREAAAHALGERSPS